MKLSLIPKIEPTVKQIVSLKQSTMAALQQYLQFYEKTHGTTVSMKDMTAQMLVQFMQDDKAFQRVLRQSANPVVDVPTIKAAPEYSIE